MNGKGDHSSLKQESVHKNGGQRENGGVSKWKTGLDYRDKGGSIYLGGPVAMRASKTCRKGKN